MVISAIRGTPATAKSPTEQLKTFKRTKTSFPTHSRGTSSEGSTTPTHYDSHTEGEISSGDQTGDSIYHEEWGRWLLLSSGSYEPQRSPLLPEKFLRPAILVAQMRLCRK